MISLPWSMEARFDGATVSCERYGLEHVTELAALEKLCFRVPWSLGLLRQETLDRDYAWNLVWMLDGALRAYTFNWIVLDEMHLLNFAVHPEMQGRGLGGYVLDWMIARAAAAKFREISLEVRESNRKAIGLYESRGFEIIARRVGYYTDDGEDALIMVNLLEKGRHNERD